MTKKTNRADADIKVVGRFIHRGCDATDGLLIGAAFKGNDFKPSTVYEIVDVLGQLQIRELGDSHIRPHTEPRYGRTGETWASSIEQLLNENGPALILTRQEMADVLYKRRRETMIKQYGIDTVAQWELEGKDLNDISY
jgi:hypothetical protein